MKVRYYGHVGQATGFGRAAAEACLALLRAGVDLELAVDRQNMSTDYLPGALINCIKTDDSCDKQPDVAIAHTLPLDCRLLQAKAKANGIDAGVWIASTTWDAYSPVSNQVLDSIQPNFEQVWLPSLENANAFFSVAGTGYAEVRHVPHPFDCDSLPKRLERHQAVPMTPDTFRFYYLGAWSSRKNVEGLVRAFVQTFTKHERVELHLYIGADRAPFHKLLAETALSPHDIPAVVMHSDPMTDDEVLAVHSSMDCYVTASRWEGFNLPAFDATLAGRHVIAPANHGSSQFLSPTMAAQYEAWPTPAFGDVRVLNDGRASLRIAHGVTGKDLWLEPDLSQLSREMRRTFEDKRRFLEWRDRRDTFETMITQRFGHRTVGEQMRRLLEAI